MTQGGNPLPPVLFVALQSGAIANGGIASLGEVMRSLDRYRPVLVTNLESPAVARWRKEGIEIHVVPESASRGLREAPLGTLASYVRYFRALHSVLGETGARIVHANDPLAFQLAWGAVRARRGTRMAFSIRDTLAPERPVPRRRFGWIFGSADHTFFLSHDMKRRWAEVVPEADLRSSVTYSIVDFDRFRLAPLQSEGPKVVLVSGVISPKKGQLRFLRSIAPTLAAANIETWLTGDFAPETSDYAQQCLLAAKPLGDRVRFLGYHPDLPKLLSRAHVVCIPSRYEGLMRTMIEAMAVGRPVVSTDVSSAAELLAVPGRQAGYVFPLDFGADMGEAIIRLCENEALNRSLGASGAAIARELLDRSCVIPAYQAVYDRVSARRDSS